MSTTSCDQHFLDYAITLAERGIGRTAPNPSVGAVLVQLDDKGTAVIVGEATTANGGRPHAETQAIAMAGEAAKGATLYVSLEPCNHHGKTPPCTDAIKAAGVARVVCAVADPDTRVAGQGLAALEAVGISMERLAPNSSALSAVAGHIMRVCEGRPFVRLKMAVSSDGLVAPGDDAPVWVTGDEARARAHLLRARADAILIGRGTLAADNPSLTCRLPGLEGQSPRPVILDTRLETAPASRLVTDNERTVLIVCAEDAVETVLGNAELLRVPRTEDGHLDPAAILRILAEADITSLLIEGGPAVAGSFLDAGLVDEVCLFQGTVSLDGNGLKPLGAHGPDRVTGNADWQNVSSIAVGEDTMTVYRHTGLTARLHG